MEATTWKSDKLYSKISSQQEQLVSSSWQRTQPRWFFHQSLCTIKIRCPTFFKSEKGFTLCWKQFTTKKTPKTLLTTLWSYIMSLHYVCPQSHYVHSDCGIAFYIEARTEVGYINWERKSISRSCQNPKCIPSNDQRNCSIDQQLTTNIFLNSYNFWGLASAASLSFNHTNGKDSMLNQYTQTTSHQHRTKMYPAFSIFRLMDCKRKALRVSFFILSINLLKRRTTERNIRNWTNEELSDIWEPRAMDEFPTFVMNCNCISV